MSYVTVVAHLEYCFYSNCIVPFTTVFPGSRREPALCIFDEDDLGLNCVVWSSLILGRTRLQFTYPPTYFFLKT